MKSPRQMFLHRQACSLIHALNIPGAGESGLSRLYAAVDLYAESLGTSVPLPPAGGNQDADAGRHAALTEGNRWRARCC
ncbi:MAG: hypothetical protein U1F42_02340 [Candidatus Competibacteraceae bacterium]